MDYYCDDPIDDAPTTRRKAPKILALIICAVLGGSFIQTTLAQNVSINSGAPIEFGQGVGRAVACDNAFVMTPSANFTNASGAGLFALSGITLTNLDTSASGCAEKTLTFAAYNQTGGALTTFSIFFSGGNFYSGDGSLSNATGQGTTSSAVTLVLTSPAASAKDVYKITAQSSPTPPQAIFTGSPSVAIPFVAAAGNWPNTASLSYQWQSSADGLNGWTNLTSPSATTASYSPVTADVNKYLRLREVDASTQQTSYSLPSNTVGSFISNGDFTIEMWVKATTGFTSSGRQELFSYGMNGWPTLPDSHRFDITYGDGDGYWDIYTGELGWTSFSTTPAVVGTWYHIAITRKDGQLHLFLNGVEGPSHPNYNVSLSGTTASFFCLGGDMYYNCYGGPNNYAHALLANMRAVNGTALYQSNFTPSLTAPTNISNTTFLLSSEIASPTTLVLGPNSYYAFVPPAGSGLVARGSSPQTVADTPVR